MKTSASETRLVENYIQKQLPPADQLVFEARLLLCPELNEKLKWQQQVHQLIKLRGRKQLKEQIKTVEQKIFTQPAYQTFRDKLYGLFKK
jgi:hypothetical protein